MAASARNAKAMLFVALGIAIGLIMGTPLAFVSINNTEVGGWSNPDLSFTPDTVACIKNNLWGAHNPYCSGGHGRHHCRGGATYVKVSDFPQITT